MSRESDKKHYVQLLQQELDRRSKETVVMAAKMREMKTQLSENQPEGSDSLSIPSLPAVETPYKRGYFSPLSNLISAAKSNIHNI